MKPPMKPTSRTSTVPSGVALYVTRAQYGESRDSVRFNP